MMIDRGYYYCRFYLLLEAWSCDFLGSKIQSQDAGLTAVARIIDNELTPKKAVLELMNVPQVPSSIKSISPFTSLLIFSVLKTL